MRNPFMATYNGFLILQRLQTWQIEGIIHCTFQDYKSCQFQ
jgi:hypothetical protein